MTDFGLILTYIMIGVAVIACTLSPILQMKNHPKKIKNMFFPLLAFVIIIGISFFIASDEVLANYTNTNGLLISSGLSKIVGGALISFYILSIIAIGSVIYSEFLYKIFKNGKK